MRCPSVRPSFHYILPPRRRRRSPVDASEGKFFRGYLCYLNKTRASSNSTRTSDNCCGGVAEGRRNEFSQIYGCRKSLEPVTRKKIKRGFKNPLVTWSRFRWGLFILFCLFISIFFFCPASSWFYRRDSFVRRESDDPRSTDVANVSTDREVYDSDDTFIGHFATNTRPRI